MSASISPRSRFSVLSQGEQAWARDGSGSYFFDGLRFWMVRPDGRRRVVVSWRTPSYGWVAEGEAGRSVA
jgi:hypothetical protein